MQHSRPPQLPLCSSFNHHRSNIRGSRFTIEHLTLPKPTAVPAWASLPTPPMSGSPPPDPPIEPPQIAGRRRKRSLTPPTTTATAAASFVPTTPLVTTAPRPAALSRGGETIGELPSQPGLYAPNYPPPPSSYQAASSVLSSSVGVSEPRFALSPLSPRTTRKPKAHVASACVNCKKKHLRCDSSRPCRRCVQSGKEDTCADVEHKKRGRPPLKPDDPATTPRYQLATPQYPPPMPAASAPLAGSTRFPTYSQGQGLAPLLPSPAPWIPRAQQGSQSWYPTPAQPSISPSLATAEGMLIPPSGAGHYGGPPPMLQGHSLSPYAPQADPAPRPMTYTGYGQSGHPYLTNPIFPRSADQLPPLQTSSAVQLPPIYVPATAGPVDPAIVHPPAPQTQPSREEQQGRGTQEPGAKRPKMDIKGILGPRND